MVNERIQELINKITKGNKRAFAKLIGVSPTVIENIVGSRQGKPGYELLEKITNSIENVNSDWILTGKEPMFHDNAPIRQDNRANERAPIYITAKSTRNEQDSCIYEKLYKEEKEISKKLAEEIGTLKERIRQLENLG